MKSGALGHYEIIELLGAGGMGEVYRAHDSHLRRDVAVKVLPEELSGDPERLARLEREAHLLASLNHPNIATIHSIEEAGEVRFLVLELIEGETLSERLRAGPLGVEEGLRLSRQIAGALGAAHEKGIVHRDLKPANVKVSATGEVKVLDFGLAKAVATKDRHVGSSRLATVELDGTQAGIVLGTAPYMSPEQARGRPVDQRTDIWAFGCVLFELLTGKRAFAGTTASDTIAAVLRGEPDWCALPDDCPDGVLRLLRKCLEKEPEARPAAFDELRDTIDRIQSDRALAATLPRAGVETLSTSAPLAARRWRKIGLAALLLALGVIAASWMILGGRREPTTSEDSSGSMRVAVLPFSNLGSDEEQYFSEGITQDVNTQLSKIGGFVVIAHGSARRATIEGRPYSEIATQLGVDYVVDGSVSKVGNRVRITASLIEPESGEQLWADGYDRQLSVADILTVRSDVAQQVADALDITLSPAERVQLAARTTSDIAAYQAYQRGRFFWEKRTPADLESAVGYFEEAIALDPTYALAYAGLADVFAVLPWFTNRVSPEVLVARAESAANQALTHDPSLGNAHATLGLIAEMRYQWAASERELRLAVTLSPEYATAHHWYANLLGRLGRHEESLVEIQKALELDPLSLIINQDLGYNLGLAGRTEEAIRQYERTLELEEDFPATRMVLALALLRTGKLQQAAVELRHWASVADRDPEVVSQVVDLIEHLAEHDQAKPIPSELEIESIFPTFSIAQIYLLIGHPDKTLEFLEQGYREGAWHLMEIGGPAYDSLRSDPRFRFLLAEVGLE